MNKFFSSFITLVRVCNPFRLNYDWKCFLDGDYIIPICPDKLCPILSGSRQCYKLLINYVLLLHVKSFIPVRRYPFIVLPGSPFDRMKSSHVIPSARLSGIKRKCKKIYTNTTWKTVPPCWYEIWFPHIIVGWNLSRLDELKFHPGKPGLCNHHLI